jgi:hypothetical protein
MGITTRDHDRIDLFCRRACTKELGWDKFTRKECRERTMCLAARGIMQRNAENPQTYAHMAIAAQIESERDRLKEENRRLRGETLPQRQDSLNDQLRDVITLATKAGCYAAADFIKNALNKR